MAASVSERFIISRYSVMNKTASVNWFSPLTAMIGAAARRLTLWLASVTAVPIGRPDDGVDRPVWRNGTEVDRSWGEQVQSLSDALEAWRTNPLARRLISLITAYTIGDGIRISSSYRPLAKFIRELYAHPLNNLELELPEWSDELSRSGELFLTLHTNPVDGMSYVRAIPASVIDHIETRLIVEALEKTNGNKNQAARLLGLNRTTLIEKIKKKGLESRVAARDVGAPTLRGVQ